ncbi:MAG: tetratricopeptide repeat protein [Bacteroidota bacterium]|nr:tetratricopeptide repeat protein [Bacteroidota bacterium]
MSQNSDTIVCSGCGVVNPPSSVSCSGCGSILVIAKSSVPGVSSASKSAKTETIGTPQWLKIILGVFVVYGIAMFIYEGMNLPSGSVQRGEQSMPQAQAQTQTDPAIVNKITELEKLLASDPNDAETILQFANALHDAKFYPRAVEMYKKYVALNPANNDARVDLGICYFEIGNLDQAVKEIEFVVKKDPKHQMAVFNLGIIQLSSKNLDEAKKWFKQCIAIDPQSTAGLRAQQILEQH